MHDVASILESVLGAHHRTKSVEYYYKCPFCNHHKHKLAVNIRTGRWHCWVCEKAGRSVLSLLRNMNVAKDIQRELYDAVSSTLKSPVAAPVIETPLTLPPEWKPLHNSTSMFARRAQQYVAARGLTEGDLIRYNIGFCTSGEYANRIIVPSYDIDGKLNYFTGRDYTGTAFLKYKNPPVSKDVIGFASYINWDFPVVLVEGFFDAIATRWNAVPLIGSTISRSLFTQLVVSNVPVYIALDDDAIHKVFKIAVRLLDEGLTVKYVKLPLHDPADIGFMNMQKLIGSAVSLDYVNTLTLKINSL